MKQLNYTTKFFAVVSLLLSACNLSEINEDGNRPGKVPTSSVLLAAEKQLMDNVRSQSISLRGAILFSQYFSQISYTAQSTYDIPLESSDEYWDEAYLALNNLNYIIEYNSDPATQAIAALGGRNANQIAVSRVLKAFAFHSLTDVFGAIPYQSYGNDDPAFEALLQNPDNYTPVYASQEKIYIDLLNELQAAGDTLLKYKGENTFGTSDIIYQGNNAKWAKFANSLRLRLATRIRTLLPAVSKQHFDDALAKGVFESNQDNAIFTYSTNAPNEAPLYRATVTANRKDFAVSNVLVDALKGERGPFNFADPRLSVYASHSTANNVYLGLPYGLSQSAAASFKADTVSLPGAVVNAANFGEVLQEYAEVAFLIAEYKDWDNAEYRKGVQASLERWKVDAVAVTTYMANLPVATKEYVLTQKYLALYMQGIEAWSEIRRTGYPLFLVKPGDVIWVDGKGVEHTFEPLFGDDIPSRLRYPSKEQSVNRVNYQQALSQQGNDAIDTRIWWNK